MRETSKAMRRRWCEDEQGFFPWRSIFVGRGIDVGCGDDKLPFESCIGFDRADGDANDLTKYFKDGEFDYLHASQSLEHMRDPDRALQSWIQIVKSKGHLIFTVPDWCLYEGMSWPSRFNPDHKSTWSLSLKGSPAPIHVYLPEFLKTKIVAVELLSRQVDTNYDYKIGASRDQTLSESEGVEAFIEVVLLKP